VFRGALGRRAIKRPVAIGDKKARSSSQLLDRNLVWGVPSAKRTTAWLD
jgi:hypothetical protein